MHILAVVMRQPHPGKNPALFVLVPELDDERQLSVFTRLACGAVAGTTGQTVAYPLDVVRRRLQVGSAEQQQ